MKLRTICLRPQESGVPTSRLPMETVGGWVGFASGEKEIYMLNNLRTQLAQKLSVSDEVAAI